MTGATHKGSDEDTGADNDDMNRGILWIVVSEPVISRLAMLNVEVKEEQAWQLYPKIVEFAFKARQF